MTANGVTLSLQVTEIRGASPLLATYVWIMWHTPRQLSTVPAVRILGPSKAARMYV